MSSPFFLSRLLPWALIIVGSVARLLLPFQINPIDQVWSDWATHWSHALNPIIVDPLSSNHPILYQIWLSAVARITNGDAFAIAIYSGALSVLTAWLWYRWVRELTSNGTVALYAWTAIALLPSWIGIYSYFAIETLLLPTLGLALWMSWRCLRRQDTGSFVWALLAWFAAMLTKGTALPLACVAIFWLCLKLPQKLKHAAIVVVVSLLLLVPLAYRSYRLIGVIAPFGYLQYDRIYFESGKKEVSVTFGTKDHPKSWFFVNSSASLYFKPFWPYSEWPNFREGVCEIFIDLDRKRESWQAALIANSGDLQQRLRNQLENIVYMLWSPSWPNQFDIYFWDWSANRMRWIWAPLLLLVTILNTSWIRRCKAVSLVMILNMIGWLAILVLPLGVGEGRYRKPFEGLLIGNLIWLVLERKRSVREDCATIIRLRLNKDVT